ncbi:hypothetical protein KO516_18215 [Citreicella sp. C3M06]|uniref:hypothetical protein n=1 Tax=Citreicella sp. C3M06 TaxID=2841564 RepID=UPI001C08F329|nr:hypothetical protein [Citreicella sp. C3M06]MBU2962726.1 hypothetical protein [Citreicella sp. C3M06]
MAKAAAPSMPTPRQIEDAWKAVRALEPRARIVSVGPDGVKFGYDADENRGKQVTSLKRYGEK